MAGFHSAASTIIAPASADPHWRQRAACRDHPGDLDKDWLTTRAATLCAACRVSTECLEFALAQPKHQDHGIWAGTTRADRVRIRRQQAQQAKGSR